MAVRPPDFPVTQTVPSMSDFRIMRLMAGVLACLALAFASPAARGGGDPTDGHSHAEDEAATVIAGPPTTEADGSIHEAVLELVGDHILVWIDDRATNAPVSGARLTVSVDGRDLPVRAIEPGTFRIDLASVPSAPLAIALAVESPAGADLLEATLRPIADAASAHGHAVDWRSAAIGAGAVLGLLVLMLLGRRIYRRRAAAPAAALVLLLAAAPLLAHGGEVHGDGAAAVVTASRPARLPDGQVFLPKPSQRIMGVRTVVVVHGSGVPAVRLAGRVLADPSRTAQVATAIGGRLSPVGGRFPRVGQPVRAGQALLAVVPALDAAAAQASASELRALDREIAIADADYRRLSQLEGVVARAEIERARLTLAGLRAQRVAAARPVQTAEQLRAPIAGRIARVSARVGELAAPGQMLVEIEGASPALVEVAAPAAVAGRAVRSAEAETAAGIRVPLRLVGRSPGLQGGVEQMQFVPAAGGGVLRTGETVTLDMVLAAAPDRRGFVVPAGAFVRDGGTDVLFVKTGPTRFAPRVVRARPLAGGVLLVEAGLATGDRVVSEGAALLAQVR